MLMPEMSHGRVSQVSRPPAVAVMLNTSPWRVEAAKEAITLLKAQRVGVIQYQTLVVVLPSNTFSFNF